MKRLVVATRNPHKIKEIRLLFGFSRSWRLVFLDRYPNAPRTKETGKTFDRNALLKARAVSRYTGEPAIADDSGIEVAALGGKPGILSARFAGPEATDRENNEKLLRLLKNIPPSKRQACYRCSIALVFPDGKSRLFHGTLSGRIGLLPKGRGGFGYDPIFILPRYKKSVAQLPLSLKNRISHRARAFQHLKRFLATYSKRRSRR